MSISQLVLFVSLPLFARSLPLYSLPEALDPQAIFDSILDDIAPLSISGNPSIQDILDTPPPSPTTVWFSPEESPVPPQPSTNSGIVTFAPSPRPIVAAYYPDWTVSQLPPEMVDFDRLDWVDFGTIFRFFVVLSAHCLAAFAVPDPTTYTPKFSDQNSADLLDRLVSYAHAKKKFVKLSIGGWTGSA